MRRLALVLTVIALVVAAARDTMAARATAFLDTIETTLQQRVADVATPASLKKLFGKHLKRLGKTTTTLAQDVATARAVLPAIEKKAPDDAMLIAGSNIAVAGLTNAVQVQLAGVEASANALRGKRDPLLKIDKLLSASRNALVVAQAPGSLFARLAALRTALTNSLKANTAVVKATGGGGGGGGGICGPTPKPAGLRAMTASESFTAHVKYSTVEYDFVGESVVAKVAPLGGAAGQPLSLAIKAFDCVHGGAVSVAIPFPPTVDVSYVNGQSGTPGVDAGFGELNGLHQLFPGGVTVKATAFNQQAKTITLEFSVFGTTLTNARVTIRNWTGP